MIELLSGAEVDDKIGNYVATKISLQYKERPKTAPEFFGPYRAIGIFGDNGFLGGVIWHNYQKDRRTIEVSIATEGPGWATRSSLRDLFSYPYTQLGCQKIRAIVAKSNKKARKLLKKLGFKFVGNDRKGLGNDDAIIHDLLRSECKWLRLKHSNGGALAPIALSPTDKVIHGQGLSTINSRPDSNQPGAGGG